MGVFSTTKGYADVGNMPRPQKRYTFNNRQTCPTGIPVRFWTALEATSILELIAIENPIKPTEGNLMTKTVTGSYESNDQIKNTREDLIATGIPQEMIFIDKDNMQIKVMISNDIEPEIEEILNRHDASSMTVTTQKS